MGRLKAYEERIAEDEEVEEDKSKLLYADGQANQQNRSQYDQTNRSEQANRDYQTETYRGR